MPVTKEFLKLRAKIIVNKRCSDNFGDVRPVKRSPGGKSRAMISSLSNLIDLLDPRSVLSWKHMEVFEVPADLLRPGERKKIKKSAATSHGAPPKNGLLAEDVLQRIVSYLSIESEVEAHLPGSPTFQDKKDVVNHVLDNWAF